MIDKILEFNKQFVDSEGYKPYITSKFPDKKIAIVTCMDTRLTELLPAALGLKNGDAKIIKNAGGIIVHPFGSVMRSLLVAIYDLGVNEIYIIGHTDCGVQNLDSEKMIEKMTNRDISVEMINLVQSFGIDLSSWLKGFDNVTDAVKNNLRLLDSHPLIPKDISIYGFVIDSTTGLLNEVK